MPCLSRLLPALALVAACAPAASDPAASTGARAATPGPDQRPDRAVTGPIILELFTSQGCSSCPPADRVLAGLVRDGAIGDRAVMPLAFHVDYWNDLGWADPFSRPAWSERQQAYAASFGDDRIYTPELVVGGRGHVLGSDRAAIRTRVLATPTPSRLDATITWQPRVATVTATAPVGADVWVAVYEDGLTTTIARGENAGTLATGDHVVRRLERVAAAGRTATVDVALDPSWQRLGAVAFAQGKDRFVVASRALDARPARTARP